MTWSKLQRFINKTIANNLWKVKSLGYEFDDLKQEAWLIYHQCKQSYTGEGFDDDKQFMVYYKTAFDRKITRLGLKAKKDKEFLVPLDEFNSADILAEDDIFLQAKLAFAPDYIKKVLDLVNSPPEKINTRHIRGDRGFNSNQRLCKALGITKTHNSRINILEEVKEYIRE